jgi:hypothetical protein
MTKQIESDGNMTDQLLKDLSDRVAPTMEAVEVSENHALFTLGVNYLETPEGEPEGVETFLAVAGFHGIIAEGLYAELHDQIEQGNMSLFAILRDVIRDLEEDLGIDPDAEFDEEDDVKHLH